MRSVILWISLSIMVVACGIPLGGGTPNDAKPSGTIITQANIQGASGKQASGGATVYLDGATYILRFDGLSVQSGNGLQVIVNNQSGQVSLRTALRATTGNQNYTIGATSGAFANVEIFSTATQADFARAVFPPSTP